MRPSALTAALKGMLALLVGHTCFDDCANVMVMARLAKASAGNRRIGSLLEMRERHSIRVRLKADTTKRAGPFWWCPASAGPDAFLVVSGFSRTRRAELLERATSRSPPDGRVQGVRPRAMPPPHRRVAPGRR